MKITHKEIRHDTEEITKLALTSDKEIPSFLSPIKRLKFHLIIFYLFSAMTLFFMPQNADFLTWVGLLGFGTLNWIFILGYLFGYDYLFSMVNSPAIRELKLVKIMAKKIHAYGLIWLISIIILGVASLVTELSIGSLVIGNFILTLLGIMIFSVDVSRYQLSGVVGVVSGFRSK
ncbi:MAG: hypothetical protein FT726_04765 [Pantoea sp. Morm]|uniref:hypothetical protein n=1 Tax=Pantoea sp. Morm TaxID=2601250 RepID=UPI001D641876|nr:hypothetical protein [Pantoea sp. Morm]